MMGRDRLPDNVRMSISSGSVRAAECVIVMSSIF